MSQLSWKEGWDQGPGPTNLREYIVLFVKGMMMGIADLIPGVSGGTIAFITGIYENMLEAVATLRRDVFADLLTFKIKSAFAKIHVRFLITLVPGILLSIFLFARLMHFLITEHPIPTWGLFFGLIAASVVVVGKEIENVKKWDNLSMVIVGAAFAYAMVSLIPVSTPDDLWFIFICGMIGICAMILPGISGSFLLLILGKYEYITGMVKNPFVGNNFYILCIFACGTFTGLLGFSKVLNWLLKHYRIKTMCFLTGILIGSLKKVWPWKEVLETVTIRGKTRVLREANILPGSIDSQAALSIALIILGFIAVLIIENYSRKRRGLDKIVDVTD